MQCLRFERNVFKNVINRKLNAFDNKYGIYFTRETGFFYTDIFPWPRTLEYIQNPVSLVKKIPYLLNIYYMSETFTLIKTNMSQISVFFSVL